MKLIKSNEIDPKNRVRNIFNQIDDPRPSALFGEELLNDKLTCRRKDYEQGQMDQHIDLALFHSFTPLEKSQDISSFELILSTFKLS